MLECYYQFERKDYPFITSLECGFQDCYPNHTPGPRRNEFWLLHYVISGTGTFKTKNSTYHPCAGDCFVMHPNELYHYQADEKDPWQYVWLGFSSEFDLPSVLSQDVLHIPEVSRVFLSIKENYGLEKHVNAFVYGKTFELLGILWDNSEPPSVKKSNSDIIKQAKFYINQNFRNNISVAEVSDFLSLDRSYFSKLFKKYVGMSPQDYINNKRFYAAAIQFFKPDCTVSDVANYIGYNDVYSFSRMFKKHYGVSPTEFISSCKKDRKLAEELLNKSDQKIDF